ncbi:ABC transporter permease [Kallotenue papyrolyticum]|uniref:ABC transporter permease n=1 Tax=Kallotenue papyrolyticum TaxID=1325125 RepID=UPI0004785986|nr:ABC transporter permease [Kallotenue papyrolyticum]
MMRRAQITSTSIAPTSRSATRRRRATLTLLLASLPLLAIVLIPLAALLLRVQPALLTQHLFEAQTRQAIALSLTTTAMATLLALLGGTPLAYLLARRSFRGRAALDTLIDLPMVLPPSVAGIALLLAFGRRGLIGQYLVAQGIEIAFTPIAVVLAQLFVAAPFYIKAAAAGFAAVDRELEQAAAIDGASPLRVFSAVTLPLAGPTVLGGLVMTWARALGEFGATIIFAGNFPGRTQTMPLAIYIGFELAFERALTLALILLACSFGVLLTVKRLLGQTLRPL